MNHSKYIKELQTNWWCAPKTKSNAKIIIIKILTGAHCDLTIDSICRKLQSCNFDFQRGIKRIMIELCAEGSCLLVRFDIGDNNATTAIYRINK